MPFSFRPITVPDPDGTQVPPVACTGCATLTVGATSDTKGSKLVYRIILTDSLDNMQGTWGPFTLVAGQVPDWGTLFVGMDSSGNQPTLPIVADKAFIKVDSLDSPAPATPAKWTLVPTLAEAKS